MNTFVQSSIYILNIAVCFLTLQKKLVSNCQSFPSQSCGEAVLIYMCLQKKKTALFIAQQIQNIEFK